MSDLKISVITVCYHAESTIAACIRSVARQTYPNVQHIVIDGGSADGTMQVIQQFEDRIDKIICEPDKGIYDAINKGLALATGDITGILNADDVLATPDILTAIAEAFTANHSQILYGDVDYVDRTGRITRKWRSGAYTDGMFNRGWMPPHPTFYCRSELYSTLGNYSLNYGTAADYELMLRFVHLNKIPVYYLPRVLVKMTVGGVSNRSVKNRIKALYYDMLAMYNNKVFFPPIALIFKPLRKLKQFI